MERVEILMVKMELVKKLTMSYFNDILKEYNLSELYAKYLAVISKQETTLSEISRKLQLDKANTTRVIGKLEALNLVVKKKMSDNRKFIVSLTDKGKALAQEINKKINSWLYGITKDIPESELLQFTSTLEKLIGNALFSLTENK